MIISHELIKYKLEIDAIQQVTEFNYFEMPLHSYGNFKAQISQQVMKANKRAG